MVSRTKVATERTVTKLFPWRSVNSLLKQNRREKIWRVGVGHKCMAFYSPRPRPGAHKARARERARRKESSRDTAKPYSVGPDLLLK